MRNCRKGFTLTEMAVVMGMIILFIGMAIPTVRALTGNSSISMARNQLGALLVRVREEAVAIQDYRGVVFIIEPTTNRVMCVVVQPALCQDTQNLPLNAVLLDAAPNHDTISLPVGVRLQTMYNGLNRSQSSKGNEDRYLGFNPVIPQTPGSTSSQYQRYYGGCILFDGNGNLVVKPYGLQLVAPGPPVTPPATPTFQQSALAYLLGFDPKNNPANNNGSISWPIANGTASLAIVPGYVAANPPVGPFVTSQVGLVLFDGDAFKTLGFTDDDADLSSSSQSYSSGWPNSGISELAEEAWLDANSTPVMINRYDGTLIRGE